MATTSADPERRGFQTRFFEMEANYRATLNILEDFEGEKARLEQTQQAAFNILDDFDDERRRSEDLQRATFNVLEDFEAEKARLEQTQRATFNILGDFEAEKMRLEEAQRATLNILDDLDAERIRLEQTQRATLNILQDLDDEKIRVERAERELAARAQELSRSNKELEQFAYVASHDLQEPLRTVYGAVSRIAKTHRGVLGPESDELIDFAVKGANRMRELVQDLLAFSRVGTRAAPMVPLDADALLDETLDLMAATLHESGARIERDPLPRINADASQFVQVLQNLIANGIKFRGTEPPVIQLGAVRDGGSWRFHVRDNGIGIAPEDLPRLFIIFQRLHTRAEYPGSGIGLAICKKIVERHGGTIWVESTPGQGSTFYFTMPCAKEGDA